jgi:hypothetical protein
VDLGGLRGAQVFSLAGRVVEVEQLWVAGQEDQRVCGGGGRCEAASQRDRGAGLEARRFDHPGGSG